MIILFIIIGMNNSYLSEMRFQRGRQEPDAHGRDDNTGGRQHYSGNFQYFQYAS